MSFRWEHRLARGVIFWQSRRVVAALDYDTSNGRGPELSLSRSGKNSSPAGFGPKPWPRVLHPLCRGYWTGYLVLPLPYISWGRAYRGRRVGALAVWRVLDRGYRAVCWGRRH